MASDCIVTAWVMVHKRHQVISWKDSCTRSEMRKETEIDICNEKRTWNPKKKNEECRSLFNGQEKPEKEKEPDKSFSKAYADDKRAETLWTACHRRHTQRKQLLYLGSTLKNPCGCVWFSSELMTVPSSSLRSRLQICPAPMKRGH